ncbi:hypothetical protein [Mangrovimonas sp. YM274]|uniref:hypothetical protein n=1 Tax=Mangrovimonas sp. YM274 TaxID=3070660 RepID=UPI0027DC0079|nr:hypothetical protein [Mangrovimonas sp. YM274]WMI67171.1 hypothetical protein RBH95_08440 [Mangrovimonas sp. YM274]
MKQFLKLTNLFALAILLSAFTCENEPLDSEISGVDGNNTGNSGASLVGDWTTVSFNATMNTSTGMGGMNMEVDAAMEGVNMDYIVTFTNNTFSTNGSYDIETDLTVNGMDNGTTTSSLSDVNGTGNYSTSGNTITFDGSLFDLEVDGIDTSALGEAQSGEYSLSNNGQTLTITQAQDINQSQQGVQVTSTVESVIVLNKL